VTQNVKLAFESKYKPESRFVVFGFLATWGLIPHRVRAVKLKHSLYWFASAWYVWINWLALNPFTSSDNEVGHFGWSSRVNK